MKRVLNARFGYIACPRRRFQHRRGLVPRRERRDRRRARASARLSRRGTPVDRGLHRRTYPAEQSALIGSLPGAWMLAGLALTF